MDSNLNTLQELDTFEIGRSYICETDELRKFSPIHKNDFTVISQNIRSIYHNFDDFTIMLHSLNINVDVIVLTECRLSSEKPIPQLPNYTSFSTTFHLNQNDGVVLYVKSSLMHKIKEIKLVHASCLQVDILNHTLLCIYRSPSNTCADHFIHSLDTHLCSLGSQSNIVIAGDININISPREREQSYELSNRLNYLNMLSSHGILPGHSLPTRENSCLDHFMIKIDKSKVAASIAILKTTITDHLTTFMCLTKIKNKQIVAKTKIIIDYEKAYKSLLEKNLADLLLCDDPNSLTEKLTKNISEALSANTIIINIPKRNRIIKPWVTTGLLRCIRNRNKMQKHLRNDPHNEVLKITYKRYRNFCNKLLKKLKRKYEKDLITSSSKNTKKLWNNIKSLTYINQVKSQSNELLQTQSTPIESVNHINKFFSSIGKNLAESNISDKTTYDHCKNIPFQSSSFVLLQTDPLEVHTTLMNLKNDSAPGCDNIPTKFLKYVADVIVPIISHLVNVCFDKGIFPNLLKHAIITPVYKNGDKEEVNNYRPISVLSALSKIVEKLINCRLLKYFESFNILSANQFGFRQGKCTEDAVAAITSLIVKNLDIGDKCLAVFLDIKKAFDTVSVSMLLQKLERIGIRGTPLALLRDYLSGRKQCTKIGSYVGDFCDLPCYGVPQGSVLGPTLFLVYINDLCNMQIHNAKLFSYADDTAIVFTNSSWELVAIDVEKGLAQVAKWLSGNLLTLNANKTNYVCFTLTNRTQPSHNFQIKIHNCCTIPNKNCSCPIITKVPHTKYLGVMIDQRLKWHLQIDQVSSRIRKLIWIFKSLRHIVPVNKIMQTSQSQSHKNLLNIIYIALAQSIITYCITLWGGALKTKFLEVERAQRSLLKVMYFKPYRFPTDDLYKCCDLLTVRKLYVVLTVCKRHRLLTYDPNITNKRRKDIVAVVESVKTSFACNQYNRLSSYLYNLVNRKLDIYPMNICKCKSTISEWIKTLNYEDVENLLISIS